MSVCNTFSLCEKFLCVDMMFRLMFSILWLNIYVVAVFRDIVVEWVYVNAVKV